MEFVSSALEIIRSILPQNAEYKVIEASHYNYLVSWRLKDDINRPNKRSREILLTFSEEKIEDFPNVTKGEAQSMLHEVKKRAEEYYRNFDPQPEDGQKENAEPFRWSF